MIGSAVPVTAICSSRKNDHNSAPMCGSVVVMSRYNPPQPTPIMAMAASSAPIWSGGILPEDCFGRFDPGVCSVIGVL